MSTKYAVLFTNVRGAQTKIIEADSPRAAIDSLGEVTSWTQYLNGFVGTLSDGRRFRCRPAPNPKYFVPKDVSKPKRYWSR